MLRTSSYPPLLAALLRHYDDLVDQLRRRFGDRGFAREVVHDVCVNVLERPRGDVVRAPLALLRRMSHDMAVDRCRAEDRRRRWVESVQSLPDVESGRPTPEQTAAAREELQRLSDAIAALPDRCRLVFVMHKVHELPHEEVAARLGISRKTVEKHLRLGMAACRAKLEVPR